MNRFLLLVLSVLCVGSIPVYGQKQIQAFPVTTPPIVDGIHEPMIWEGADSAINFFQMEPNSGEAGSEPTVCYIGYDQEAELSGEMAYADAIFLKLTLPITIIK